MLVKVLIFCAVVAAAHASLVGPVGWGAPALAAGPWGLAGKAWAAPVAAAPYGYLGNGVIAGNGILANGLVAGHGLAAPWGVAAPYGVAKVGLAGPLGLGLGKFW
ncbi:hypothetical protein CDAR_278271 [Caerostris darwini]|uniref:Uncharacterized protein n=1 Tax=Caerostris darwini TaxID=1538125 RepID=A0AAV4WR13_9ARAC|nr:hypothetical protein CDAR_278271 [Caerostris darwini]